MSGSPWDLRILDPAPAVYPAGGIDSEVLMSCPKAFYTESEDVKPVFFEGMKHRGKSTRVFAYYGIPKVKPGEKVPGIVLVHGAGGTAYASWVKLWMERGYAAIAVDLEGHQPGLPDDKNRWPRHAYAGPENISLFEDYHEKAEDQFMYHAVANVMLAHSLLRSFPAVDGERIGVTGISRGGIITSLVCGVDPRLTFGIPVYGCGYLYQMDSPAGRFIRSLGDASDRIRQLWDPSSYFHNVRIPMLWITGSNDIGCTVYHFSKSHASIQSESILSIQYGLKHSHPHGWSPKEIYIFADSVTANGLPLPRIVSQSCSGNRISVRYTSVCKITNAKLYYTLNASNWYDLTWIEKDAVVEAVHESVSAIVPDDAKAYFVNLTDERRLTVSTDIILK